VLAEVITAFELTALADTIELVYNLKLVLAVVTEVST
jgi:hypothetical protein